MKIKIGDIIEIEQAWEDESGAYHDESAEVLAIKDNGEMELNFIGVSPQVENFLGDCEFNIKDYE